jgi:hypothetical protein
MRAILSEKWKAMPNYRSFEWRVGGRKLGVSTKPRGWRNLPILRWTPYWTGCNVAITVNVDKTEGPEFPATGIPYTLLSNVQSQFDEIDIVRSLSHPKPAEKVKSEWEYISAPGEFKYMLEIAYERKPVADFSAISKDRFIVQSLFPIVGSVVALIGVIVAVTN